MTTIPADMTNVDVGHLLIVGGIHAPPSAEVVNLATKQRCPIKKYPLNLEWGTGALVDGKPTTCGGFDAKRDCYVYNIDANAWNEIDSTIIGREFQTSSVLDDGRWIITGG